MRQAAARDAALDPFYAPVGTAAAALLGLLFVVVPTNASTVLGPEVTVLRGLTERAFQNYLAVMVLAFLALFASIITAMSIAS